MMLLFDVLTHGLCIAIGAIGSLTLVLYFTERRQKKADSFPCWDDEPHETPTWTPGGNE